jgi:2-iminobutanoate/2-iminopropanoate deaminase
VYHTDASVDGIAWAIAGSSGSVCATTAEAAPAAGMEPLVQTRTVNPDSVAPPAGNYSHAVRLELDGVVLVFVSGQLPVDAQGRPVGEGDMARQTQQVFENLRAILAANGATFRDVVKVGTYVTDMSQLAALREVRVGYLPEDPPASTLVGVSGLVLPAALLEVDVVAAVAARD